jgi:hypothetical protein
MDFVGIVPLNAVLYASEVSERIVFACAFFYLTRITRIYTKRTLHPHTIRIISEPNV